MFDGNDLNTAKQKLEDMKRGETVIISQYELDILKDHAYSDFATISKIKNPYSRVRADYWLAGFGEIQ